MFSRSFPFSRAARHNYEFTAPRVSDFAAARALSAKINATRDLETQPERAVKAGVLAGASLLDEVFSHVIEQYLEEVEASALEKAPAFLDENLGLPQMLAVREDINREFELPEKRPSALEWAIRLRLANENPALGTISELFDDSPVAGNAYQAIFRTLGLYFSTLPPFGPDELPLLELLRAPFRAHPNSIEAQLRFILESWGGMAAPFARRILTTLDVVAEENKPYFPGPGPVMVPDYKNNGLNRPVGMDEHEAFSADKAWMPSVVLLAKNTYVWLDQLSKKYERHIFRLDMVPDEELDEMAARGFTGLWLIGLWQRSKASQRIKQMCGNPDAVASAYSLHAYDIAWELGGQEAMDDLRKRAAKRGIRMASDMVPNHMAIDSRWVVEHPDWFLSLPNSPFPQYNFDGPNLSEDGRAQIYLENHYYSQSDAAVVFRHVDNASGEERFIYHGNDGTSMPWNDTAQLNYLKEEVREAVIQTILDVARQFPVIRFDAAMTLAKRHVHRLWFPSPGEGGAIPSRAGNGLPADEFDALMPQEFWREVVDRVAAEVPETLLLAEAFWMMEGFFVRTLGMHRVYNSAFMNMLRDEKNAEFRLTLKNTLEFDPDILGRFVNFMNNPDEKTAVEQFGKGEKYFGVCTLLSTLPGLPMFGHGQIEGYAEKYGMEYPRAYWDEKPDSGLVEHHNRVIFPLLHKRPLFAGSENFTLYDFWNAAGSVNEDVLAFSNCLGEQRALVIYNNRYAEAGGWIKNSASFAHKDENGEKTLAQRELGAALGLAAGKKSWTIFRDNTSNLEFLRRSRDLVEKGLFVQLAPYGCHVFLDWREVRDEAGLYELLAQKLDGSGVSSVEIALRELLLEPILAPFRKVANADLWKRLDDEKTAWDDWESALEVFCKAACELAGVSGDAKKAAHAARARLAAIWDITAPSKTPQTPKTGVLGAPEARSVLVAWATASVLGDLAPQIPGAARQWFDEWLLGSVFEGEFLESDLDYSAARRAVSLAKILLAPSGQTPFELVSGLLADSEAQKLLGVNRAGGVTWFAKEGFETVVAWLEVAAKLQGADFPAAKLREIADASEFRVVKLLEASRAATTLPTVGPPVAKKRAAKPKQPKEKAIARP